MKNKYYTIIIILITILIFSWAYFIMNNNQEIGLNAIDSKDKAIHLGIAYLNIMFPDMHIDSESYDFAVYIEEEREWVVCIKDKRFEEAKHLPCVSFDKTGKLISVGLQAD